jgi:hypothetical protein
LTGPIVLEDGSVALVSTVRVADQIIYSYRDETAFNGCAVQSHPQDYSFTDNLAGRAIELERDARHSCAGRQFAAHGFPVLSGRMATHAGRSWRPVARQAEDAVGDSDQSGLSRGREQFHDSARGRFDAVRNRIRAERGWRVRPRQQHARRQSASSRLRYESKVVQFDTETLQRISNSDLGVPMTAPQHIRLKFALAGGGVYAVGPTTAYVVNPTVDTAGFAVGGNATHVANGLWSGWSGTGTPWAAPGTEPTIAQNRWAFAAGLEKRQCSKSATADTTRSARDGRRARHWRPGAAECF